MIKTLNLQNSYFFLITSFLLEELPKALYQMAASYVFSILCRLRKATFNMGISKASDKMVTLYSKCNLWLWYALKSLLTMSPCNE